ncbi:NADH dehydrogenase [ubiquinone] 1 alpha subcomplex assembly factor 3 [Brienomyrus brachyistius]|uniref:NADH dehydrogenase [ubiquinone] 1 alpha subcomplex assembly factor 3 n=1 Tax=Brienomyrus brachyistius TaxID=42636 RepID=UPI0020B2B75E|nr:NADH dehydrogenase [ubiquinone] 1 alpha subcomplex assembly factor 3 [Brienomyrus brachyistius]XP_048879172.1 NADH dehydrogenase [ubiquinone] 1 alpha subcomplex assembly factor 3 [Brienomyrus brachyistius]
MATVRYGRLLPRVAQHSLRLASQRYPGLMSPALVRGHRLAPTDDELYQRTTVSVMQKEADSDLLIHSYSSRGFTIGRNRVLGPCAVLPPAILQWNVGSYKDISVESLALFYLLEPRIEVLVLGIGGRVERLDRNVLDFLRKKRIAVEIQDTPNACATFNFLFSERRAVAAGLIPPPISTKDRL